VCRGDHCVGNARRLTWPGVIRHFGGVCGDRPTQAGTLTPLDRALLQVLAGVDETAPATFGLITIAAMPRLVDRAANGTY